MSPVPASLISLVLTQVGVDGAQANQTEGEEVESQKEPYTPIISPAQAQNFYIFVGVNHYVPEQHQLFNEFLILGDDNLKIDGIDLIVSESFWTGEKVQQSPDEMIGYVRKPEEGLGLQHCFGDLQGIIDYYLKTGDSTVLPYLKICVYREPFKKFFDVEDIDIETLKIARGSHVDGDLNHTYDFLAGDLSYRVQSSLLGFINRLQLLEIRDYNSIRFIEMKLQDSPNLTAEVPTPQDSINTFIKERIKRPKKYDRLPKNERALRDILVKANAEGRIIWGTKNIYAYLQGVITGFKKQSRGKVILSKWGSSHTEKEGIEKYVDENDKSFCVVMNGGAYDTILVFDKVVRELGWEGKTFAWIVGENVRDADLVIHLPVKPERASLIHLTPDRYFDPVGVVSHLRKRP